MNFIDSNILAYSFYNNEFQDKCQEVIRNGGITNTVNLIEAFNIIEFETDREIATTSIKGILKSNIKIVDVDINIIFEALKKGQKYKSLKFMDLLHYTVAILNNCDAIVSYDKDFNNLELPRIEKLN